MTTPYLVQQAAQLGRLGRRIEQTVGACTHTYSQTSDDEYEFRVLSYYTLTDFQRTGLHYICWRRFEEKPVITGLRPVPRKRTSGIERQLSKMGMSPPAAAVKTNAPPRADIAARLEPVSANYP